MLEKKLRVHAMNKFTEGRKEERSSRPDVFCEKDVLRNFANSQENTCARVNFLIKLQAAPATLLKKRLWHRCFRMNFAKFLRTPFSQSTSGRLLLKREKLHQAELVSLFLLYVGDF